MKPITAALCILLTLSNVLVSETVTYNDPEPFFDEGAWTENFEVRKLLENVLFSSSIPSRYRSPRIFEQEGKSVRFEVTNSGGYQYLLFLNEENSKFPVYSRGSYIFKRDGNGRYIQVKIFLGLDTGCFLRLFPDRDRTRMDVYLYEKRLYSDVMIPLGFDRILTEPFASVVRLTAKAVDWNLIAPAPERLSNDRSRTMITAIRRLLPGLRDVEDGAMDADGSFVFIGSGKLQGGPGGLNCSGFAKWVADGVLSGIEYRNFTVAELKRRFPDIRGNRWSEAFEETRDPFFGLDWTRNIAVALARAYHDGAPGGPESADVRSVPFARYVEDIGYPVNELTPVMYYLAVKEPGTFYLASVNREYGEKPVLRQHTHVAVLFPCFTADGHFETVVFERNVETPYRTFLANNAGYDVHLVKIRVPDTFLPPSTEGMHMLGYDR